MVSLKLIIAFYAVLPFCMASSESEEQKPLNSHYAFASDIFKAMEDEKKIGKISGVFSPASIQICMTLAFMGARGDTAEELNRGLKLDEEDRKPVARYYRDFIRSWLKSSMFTMANRMYVTNNERLHPKFNKVAMKYFGSKAVNVTFADSAATTVEINNWVAKHTSNKIQHMLSADDVRSGTSVVLVNAIYFRAKWPFRPIWQTHSSQFNCLYQRKIYNKNYDKYVRTDMMKAVDYFGYVEEQIDWDFFEIIQLPLKNEMSMLIIKSKRIFKEWFPSYPEWLKNVAQLDLIAVRKKMKKIKIDLMVPKLKGEFNVDLMSPLRKLGMKEIFSTESDFSGLFVNAENQKVSLIKHKVYVDFGSNVGSRKSFQRKKKVRMGDKDTIIIHIEQPFAFAIVNDKSVLLMGYIECL